LFSNIDSVCVNGAGVLSFGYLDSARRCAVEYVTTVGELLLSRFEKGDEMVLV
jgi:hypothetical protein